MKPFRWLRAKLGGYFWMPCPACGRMFGGYEEGGTLLISEGHGRMTCKKCPHDYAELPLGDYIGRIAVFHANGKLRVGFSEPFHPTGRAQAPCPMVPSDP